MIKIIKKYGNKALESVYDQDVDAATYYLNEITAYASHADNDKPPVKSLKHFILLSAGEASMNLDKDLKIAESYIVSLIEMCESYQEQEK